jgi:1,4-dihydroxy-2-naphthoate polyprenyltransferase
MNKLHSWIHAARLRTLPLSISGIIVGAAMAFRFVGFNWLVFGLLLTTTLLLQILSNFANDFGDFYHGTDNEQRVGPQRALQSGQISVSDMKRGIALVSLLALISGLLMLYISLGHRNIKLFLFFVVLGLLAIAAALKYTIGHNPFGYRGLGDLMVFIFFGLVAVVGSYYLLAKSIDFRIWLPAVAIGFLSTGVLNINNMRDLENDRTSGKSTMIVKMGLQNGKRYHAFLVVLAIASMVTFFIIIDHLSGLFWMVIPSALLIFHLYRVIKNKNLKELDPELKRLSLITLLLSILTGVALLIK